MPRGENILEWGIQVMRLHADRKSILEVGFKHLTRFCFSKPTEFSQIQVLFLQVEFLEEEGTGLGPTLEFFALVAAELQRSDLGMWLQVTLSIQSPSNS